MVKKVGKKSKKSVKNVEAKSSRSEIAALKKQVKSAIKDHKMAMNALFKRFSEDALA